MAIVTIARERGAMGDLTARELAAQLNYRLIDRKSVEASLEAMGLTAKNVSTYDEKKPGFFAQISNMMEDYIRCLKILVYQEAAEGNCIIQGRGGQYLLKDVPGTVRIRLIAPLALRIERVQKYLGCSEREARAEVLQKDHDRSEFNAHFFDTDWKDAINYDAVLNTENLAPEQLGKIIRGLVEAQTTPARDEDGKIAARRLAAGQIICRHLLRDLKLPLFFLEAVVDGDTVTLNGLARSVTDIGQAVEGACINGITKVKSNLTVGRLAH